MSKPPKNFGSPLGNFYNPTADPDATSNYINQAINSDVNAYKSFLSQDFIRPQIEKELADNLKLKRYNSEFNSLNILASRAYGDDTSKKYATDVYNRIQNAKSKDELNSLYSEIEKLKDDSYEPLVGGSTVWSFLEPAVSGYSYLKNSLFDKSKLSNLFSKLESNNDNLSNEDKNSIYATLGTPELFQKATASINQKRHEFEAQSFTAEIPDFFKQLDKSLNNANDPNALNLFLKTKFKNKATTRGDEFYRDDEEEIKDVYYNGIRAIDDPSRRNEKQFKYDLEKNTIQTLQTSTVNKINELNSIPEDQLTPELKQEKKALVNTLNKLETRTKNLAKIYGLSDNSFSSETTDRASFLRSVVATAVVPLANLSPFRSEFEKIVQSTQIYQPEVIKYDKDNNPIMSNQFTYVKQNGEIGYNWGSVGELGGTMVGIILPTIATSSFVSGIVAGTAVGTGRTAQAAASLQKGYSQLNKVGGIKLADRISTFATVGLTTAPMMIQEEKRWGGNYVGRGFGKAMVEGLTEAVGFPDVGALRAKPFVLRLGAASKRIASAELTFGEKAMVGLSTVGQFGKQAVKQNVVEAFEEELSLLGNALLEHATFDQSMFEDGRERTKVTGDTVIDTFVDSFIGGLIYSGGTNLISARNTLSKDNLYNISNWQAVNNPELFKAKLLEQKENGVITEEQFVQGLGRVNELQTIFNANITSLSKMKDIRTLLDDKDLQYELFTTAVRQNDIINVDIDALSEEDKVKLGKIKYQQILTDKGKKRLNEIREEVAVLSELETRTPEQEKELKEKTNEYDILKKLTKVKVNRKDLSKEQIDTLANLGIVANPNLIFNQEELEKEIKDIDTSILKIKKQINKYEDLSEIDKQNVIVKLFDERIEALQKIDSPSDIVESRANLQQDLEYLKVKGEGNEFDIEQRERLYDAYGKRFQELTARGENNLNQVERKFDQPGYYSQFREGKNMFELLGDVNYLEENKEFIDETFYKTVFENLINNVRQTIDLLNNENTTSEKRLEILEDFYDKMTSTSPLTLYDLQKTNSFFTITEPILNEDGEVVGERVVATPNFTQEEMETARENIIQKRAKRASSKIANGKKPYDEEDVVEDTTLEEDTTDSQLSDEDTADVNESLDKIFTTLEETPQTLDEDTTISPAYQDAKNLYEANKNKTAAQLKEIAANISRRIFAYNKNPKSQFQLLVKLGNDYFDGKITYDQYEEGIEDLIERYPTKRDVLTVHQVFVALANNDNKVTFMGQQAGDRSTPTTAQKPTTPATSEDPSIKKRDSEVNQINVIRVRQLMSLASPLRTVGVELDRNNNPSEDPADLRRVEHLKKASSSDFESKVKVALVNRQKFMMMYLKKKYPTKSQEEIQNDLNTINTFFENSEEGDSLPNEIIKLLGDTFFSVKNPNNESKSQVNFWQSQKGKGFSQSPDVVITFVNEDGSMYLFEDGFPLDLNATARSEKRKDSAIPWNVSNRIVKLLAEEGISEKQIADYHAKTFENFEKEKEAISKDNNKVVVADYNITEGVIVNKVSDVLGLALMEENNSEIGKPTIQAFSLVTREGQEVFGQRKKFDLGRVYYNVNGTPVKLSNNLIAKEEAEALADLIFTSEFPEMFDGIFNNLDQFRNYLFNIINDTNKDSRLYFKPNREYEEGTNEKAFHTNILQKKNGKLVQLSKEEFIEVLQKAYYKVSNDYISNNRSLPRFEKIDGEVQVTTQSYVQYLLSTHSFPLDKEGNISKNVNQLVYFSIPNLVVEKPIESKPVVQTKTPSTPFTPSTATPVPTDENVDPEGFLIKNQSSPFLPNNNKSTLQVYVGSRLDVIKKLNDSGKAKNTVNFFSQMTDAEFDTFIENLASSNFIHYNLFDANGKNIELIEQKGDTMEQRLLFSAAEGTFIMIEVDGTKLLIPVSNQDNASFNLRYQPSFTKIQSGDLTTLKSTSADAVSVGVKPNAQVESNKKTITYDAEMGEAEIYDDDEFGDPEDQDVLAKDRTDLEPEVAPTETTTKEPVVSSKQADIEKRRQEDSKKPSRESVKYKLKNKIAGINNPSLGNEIPTLSEAIKIAGAQISNPIQITEGEITHVVFDQEESTFRFTYKGKQFAAFYIESARGITRWQIAKLNDKTGTYQSINLDELKNINEKYGSQKDLLLSLGAEDLVKDIEEFEKVEYSKKDKSSANGIIPLENTVSSEQIRLGKKYGQTYTLEDFLKEYDAELAALGQPAVEKKPVVKDKAASIARRNRMQANIADPEITEEAKDAKKFCDVKSSTSEIGTSTKKKKIGRK